MVLVLMVLIIFERQHHSARYRRLMTIGTNDDRNFFMSILVTGGAGFIGSALVRHLVQHTHYTIVNVDKLNYVAHRAALDSVRNHSQHVFYPLDIRNQHELLQIMRRHKPQAVFHLAAESHVDRSITGPEDFIQSNIVGTFRLLEAVRAYWAELPVKEQVAFRFIHVSTDEVYGDLGLEGQPPVKEHAAYLPSSPYSASKAASDHLVQAWYRTYEIPVILTHCTNNYGPYQYPEKLIPFMIDRALRRQPLTVYGPGHQVRDWIHVDDHVQALHLIWERGRIGQSYHVSAHQPISNIELIHNICALLDELAPMKASEAKAGQGYAQLIKHVADRPGHDQRYALDASKLRQELGWAPKIDLAAGLSDTVAWYYQFFKAGNSYRYRQ